MSSRRRYVVQHAGEAGLRDIAGGLSDEATKALLDPPLPFLWMPIAPLIEVDMRIIEVLMAGSVQSMKKFGADIANYDLPRTFAHWTKRLRPHAFITKLDFIARNYMQPLNLEVVDTSERSARVEIINGTYPYYLCALGMAGFIRAGVTFFGGDNTSVKHVACQHGGDERCSFDISWR